MRPSWDYSSKSLTSWGTTLWQRPEESDLNMSQHSFLAVEKVVSIWGCILCSRDNILGKVIIPICMTLLNPHLGIVCSLGLNLRGNLSTTYRKNTDKLQKTTKIIWVWSTQPVRSSRGNWSCIPGKEVSWERLVAA